jgi:hypothetical protein
MVLTSRLPNGLRVFSSMAVCKETLFGQISIITIGEPEGILLVVTAKGEQMSVEVSKCYNSYTN